MHPHRPLRHHVSSFPYPTNTYTANDRVAISLVARVLIVPTARQANGRGRGTLPIRQQRGMGAEGGGATREHCRRQARADSNRAQAAVRAKRVHTQEEKAHKGTKRDVQGESSGARGKPRTQHSSPPPPHARTVSNAEKGHEGKEPRRQRQRSLPLAFGPTSASPAPPRGRRRGAAAPPPRPPNDSAPPTIGFTPCVPPGHFQRKP